MQFKNIHIGSVIHQKVTEQEIEISRICNFFKCEIEEVEKMYLAENLNTHILLRWSKLLEYDFFRIYSQHLILYSPQQNMNKTTVSKNHKLNFPKFRKNFYTKELIDYILELLEKKEKTKLQIINEYRIPKTTLYKWIDKYKK